MSTSQPESKAWQKLFQAATTCGVSLLENKQYARQLSSRSPFDTALNFMIGICLLARLGENARGIAEVSAPRRSKAITASAFSRGFMLSGVNFSAVLVR